MDVLERTVSEHIAQAQGHLTEMHRVRDIVEADRDLLQKLISSRNDDRNTIIGVIRDESSKTREAIEPLKRQLAIHDQQIKTILRLDDGD